MKLMGLVQEGELHGRCVCFYCSSEPKKKPNAAVLLGAYLVLFEGWDAETAYTPSSEFEPFLPFRDPTCGISTYHLSVLDCIQAVAKGKKIGWIDFHNFNVEEYEYFEQVENGDLNWIVPNKIVAFSGPGARRTEVCGYRTLIPEDYVGYFKQSGITTIIRLNKRLYDKRRFTEHGFSHYDLYFPDGSCPPERIVQRFLETVEDSVGAVAVHCKAGLGRTGVLIGCYLMKHYRFTANEAIGYLRIVRPGSVIGPQQHFLRDIQSRMWKSGDGVRRQRSDINRNSRHYISSFVQDSQPGFSEPCSSLASPLAAMSLTGWGPTKKNVVDFQSHSMNPAMRRLNTRSLDNLSNSKRDASPPLALANSMLSKEKRVQHEPGVGGGCKSDHLPVGLHGRCNVSQRSSHPIASRVCGTTSLSMDPCSDQTIQPASGNDTTIKSSHNLRPRASLMHPNVDNAGILRNAGKDTKSQTGEGVCTQRTLNAAGQPRKVVVPVGQMGTRDSSPGRRRSGSPLRIANKQG